MKKGDIALSTSAIVALIVAIVVLGLIVVFVVRGFGSIDQRVESEASKLPEPALPTAAQPVTISAEPTATIGGQFSAKVGVYNSCDVPVTVLHDVRCRNPAGSGSETIPLERANAVVRDLQPGQSVTMSYLGAVSDDVVPGRSLCTAVISAWAEVPTECTLESFTATVPVEFVE